ncbi:MAG: hypothetical protein ACRD8U_14275 [Pyrinomonadaceae bacterium]
MSISYCFLPCRGTKTFKYPDGRKDSYSYEKGNYVTNADPSLNQFIPDANGVVQRQIIVHGTEAAPAGVAFKSTQEVVIHDQFGHVVLREVYVYTGSGITRTEWTVTPGQSQDKELVPVPVPHKYTPQDNMAVFNRFSQVRFAFLTSLSGWHNIL